MRRTIVGVGIVVWSLATAFCGLAQSFWQLFIARMGVGAGEACNGPPVFSMISDLFPREKLPLAIAVLNFGFIFGNGLASILGGLIIELLSDTPSVTLPLLGTLRSWQMVFLAVGLPGLLVGALMWTVKEPVRRGRIAKAGAHQNLPVREVVRFYLRNARTYVPMFAGLAFNIVPAVGLIIWGPEYFRRGFGWTTAEYAVRAGLVTLIFAPTGAIFGGWLAGWLQRRGRDDANLLVVLFAFLLNLPALLAFTLATDPWFGLGAFALTQFFAMWVPGPFNAALQVVTPNEMRGQITALFLFIFNIVGLRPRPVRGAVGDGACLPRSFQARLGARDRHCRASAARALSIWLGLKPYGRRWRAQAHGT